MNDMETAQLYICDPCKNTECKKTACQTECFQTVHKEYARETEEEIREKIARDLTSWFSDDEGDGIAVGEYWFHGIVLDIVRGKTPGKNAEADKPVISLDI